jgi:hypothetical protein
VEQDLDGDVSIPERGFVIERKGTRWRVVAINVETSVTEPAMIPIYRIFLTNQV